MKKIIILFSGNGTNLEAIADEVSKENDIETDNSLFLYITQDFSSVFCTLSTLLPSFYS